jgi:hypothetical protein
MPVVRDHSWKVPAGDLSGHLLPIDDYAILAVLPEAPL